MRLDAPTLEDIRAARKATADAALRTPLVRLNCEDGPAEIYLKLENLQPIGSFKLRGAGYAVSVAPKELLAAGLVTASAGNMAQGVAWWARRLGVPCNVVVPDHAPATKLEAVRRLGGAIVKVPFDQWWEVIQTRKCPGLEGFFIHPVSDPAVMAGNGVIGLEILEDLPELDAVVVPFGGGGLSSGIASAVRALKPSVRIFAAEVETAAPLAASLAAGSPQRVQYQASFVDGIGSSSVLDEIWPLARRLLDGSLVVTLEQTASAIRLMAERNRVVAEGAAGAAVAAALSGQAGSGKVVCIVSGGNIDVSTLARILTESGSDQRTPQGSFDGSNPTQ